MKHLYGPVNGNFIGVTCKKCGQRATGKVTTQCPEVKLCDDIAKRVQSGQIDLVDGVWVSLKPEQESMKQMDDAVSSLFEFMEAMVPELSSEASDELTDQDIGMLNRINRVPLPRRTVRDLVLPVELMVSLHKLKRLDYVAGNPQANQYQVTTKGKEFLKPKPVTLTMSQLHALASIGDEPMFLGDVSGYGIWAEVEYLKKLDMVHQKSGKAVISTKGYDHLQKLLAVLV